MTENISPEEKLLHLIKGQNGSAPAGKDNSLPSSASSAAGREEAGEAVPEGVVLNKKEPKLKDQFIVLNKGLVLLLVVIAGIMVLGYIFPYQSKVSIPDRIPVASSTGLMEEKVGERPRLSYYTAKMGGRKMFKIFEPPRPKAKKQEKPKVTLQQLLAGYTFVGIIGGDPPQVIVEDKKSGQNHYLTAGQNVGEIKIEDVQRGKVTVSHEEETMDINI